MGLSANSVKISPLDISVFECIISLTVTAMSSQELVFCKGGCVNNKATPSTFKCNCY